jgi:hypothetical protein
MMRDLYFITFGLLVFVVSGSAMAQGTYVPGYHRDNGTYVQPHYRSNPSRNPYDNWSAQGNVNPHTGEAGTQNIQPTITPYNSHGGRGSSYDSIPNTGSGYRNSLNPNRY